MRYITAQSLMHDKIQARIAGREMESSDTPAEEPWRCKRWEGSAPSMRPRGGVAGWTRPPSSLHLNAGTLPPTCAHQSAVTVVK